MSDPIDVNELTKAVQQVFSSMLGLELIPCAEAAPPDFPPERKVSSAVGISGDWNGTVVFECGSATARFLTSAMMGADPNDSVELDAVRDVIGEITNMVAGTFKKSLPGHSVLTLPCFIEGSDYSMNIILGRTVLTQPLIFGGKGIVLSVVAANGRR